VRELVAEKRRERKASKSKDEDEGAGPLFACTSDDEEPAEA